MHVHNGHTTSYTVNHHAKVQWVCQQPCVQHLNTEKKNYFQAAGPNQNPKNSFVLFAFPQVFPIFTAPLWLRLRLCYTQCASIQVKPNGSPAQKHYPALW